METIHERHLETKPADDSGHWSGAASQIGMSTVLASIRRSAEFSRHGILNLVKVPLAGYFCFPCACGRSIATQSKESAWLWALFPRRCVCCRRGDWKVCMGVESHHLCGSGAVGDCVCLECVASSNGSRSDLLLREIYLKGGRGNGKEAD